MGGDPPAGAAQPDLRLGDLRRRRLDARAHPRHRGAQLKKETGIDAGRAPHLRRRDPGRDRRRIARAYWDAGIRHIVALRGDPPASMGGSYTAASRRLRQRHRAGRPASAKIGDFEISVAALSRTPPGESPDADHDIDVLKRKVDAGADARITQFFFDADGFLRFRDRVRGGRRHMSDRAGHHAGDELQGTEEDGRAYAASSVPAGSPTCSRGSTTTRRRAG